MQVSVSTTGSLERRVEVAVPATEVADEVDKRLKRISRTARLKGFRPGKVPFAVVRQQFGEQVHAEVVNDLMRSSFAAALDQQKLRPAGGPRIEPIAMDPGADLRYAAVFEVLPEVRVQPPAGIKIERPVSAVLESDVDAMIESMRRQRPVYTVVERPAHDSDRVTVDFDGQMDGAAFEGGNAQGVEVIIGSQQSLPELEEALKGAAAGEQRQVTVTFPAQHRNQQLAGRAAELQVHIKKVEESSLPIVDEEFCRAYGVEQGDVEALRQEVRKSMERELTELIRSRMNKQVLDALYEQNPLDMPRALLEEQVQQLQISAARRMGVKDASQLPPREPFVEPARRRAALSLILGQIVQAEGLTVDQERMHARLDDLVASYPDPEAARRAYLESADAMRQLASATLEDQVVDWVVAQAHVTDRSLSFTELTGFGGDGQKSENPA